MELHPVRPTVKTPASNFTGDVYMTPIYNGSGPSRMTVALVRFTPVARTNWHRHAVGQTLHVTEGVGLVGVRDGSVVRARGRQRRCPPDEEHWHGAAADTFMSHLAMLEARPDGSDPTTWLEPLPEGQYRAAESSGPERQEARNRCGSGPPASTVPMRSGLSDGAIAGAATAPRRPRRPPAAPSR